MYLMASPLARGLFAGAIAQSGYMVSTPELREERHGERAAEQIGQDLTEKLGASGIADLRKMDATELAEKALAAGYMPAGTIDGHVLPRQIVDVFERGEQAPVPLMAGFTSGETRIFAFMIPPEPADSAEYEAQMRARTGALADRYLELYPANNIRASLLATARDAVYGWSAEAMVHHHAKAGHPANLYYFDHGYPAAESRGLRAFHGSEIPFLFDTLDRTPPRWPEIVASADNQSVSAALRDYWTGFARHLEPMSDDQPEWQPYRNGRSYMRFADGAHPKSHLLPGMLELIDTDIKQRREVGNISWNWNFGIGAPDLKES